MQAPQLATTYIKHAGTVEFNLLFWSAGTFYIQALAAMGSVNSFCKSYNQMTSVDSMFELGIELRNKGELRDSINVFLKILLDYPADKRTHGVYLVLAGVHADLGEHDKALINFRKATELNPKSELASLGLYVTLAKLDKGEEAIHELVKYLKNYPADLYKDTLEELLEDLEEGYMTNYEDDIRNLAKVNGVEI